MRARARAPSPPALPANELCLRPGLFTSPPLTLRAATATATRAAGALRRNYLRLSALALEAHELDAVWLDGQHLVLQDAPERPSPVGASRLPGPRPTSMLRTAAVCWLDVRGSIRGVLPGEYEVGLRALVFCPSPCGCPCCSVRATSPGQSARRVLPSRSVHPPGLCPSTKPRSRGA
jgi:hypothetical protein